jgi:hypothetical protein
MTIRSLHLLFVGVVLSCTELQLSAPAWSKTETVCGAPIAADDGWQTASTDQAGVDAAGGNGSEAIIFRCRCVNRPMSSS